MLSPQERAAIKQDIQSNQHEIYVISFEEMDNIVKSNLCYSSSAKQSWKKIKKCTEYGAGYYSSADDIRTLSKLVGDLGGWAKGWSGRAYIKHYGGKPHIILKGNPRLRKVLTGTKYGVNNAKVVTMGLGSSAAISAAKSGGIVSIILMTAYRVVDYFLTDEATLSQLIGSLATDVVKIGITTGVSIGAAYMMGFFSLAIGPIAVVVAVGFGLSFLYDYVEDRYHITDQVISVLDEMSSNINTYLIRAKHKIEDDIARVAGSVIDYVLDSAQHIVIDFAKHSFKRMLSPQPRANF
ncbi:hypothetical protein [Vibrio spartinae]|uniref:Uncharacterized protein n=1 Tax=Vibrio spartinae TaxID=1918945 RepID=A0ABX6QW13_9VIBR|nr:hypothetical protein [Vibrio spartinae]QMV13197.1 hypothetical protein Vspart_00406 [Vibrio spartinae]